MQDEHFKHEHTGPGLLAMANVPGVSNSSSSQFFISICSEALTHLNGKYVVFGRLKSGHEVLKEIASYAGDEESGIPTAEIAISDCGLVEKPT
jgi:cyclophilin family peptidyl-prolyl cis-trans isomerase